MNMSLCHLRVSRVLTLAAFLIVGTPDLSITKRDDTLFSQLASLSLASAQDINEEKVRMQVYEKANPATVAILTGKGSGSGFIVSSDGLIVTNAHVVEGGPSTVTVVLADGRRLSADVIGFDADGWDLAALRIYGQKNLPSLRLAGSDSVKVGQSVYAIGTPFGESNFNNFTWGGVSRIDRKSSIIQHTASVNPGNSGGPLLNSQAEVIGVNTSIGLPEVFEFVDGKRQPSNVVVRGNVGISQALSLSRVRQLISSGNQRRLARTSPHLQNRSQAQATELQFDGKEVSGILNDSVVRDIDGSYVNYYLFQGKAGQPVAVDMISQDLDSHLVLYQINKQADGSLKPNWEKVIAENDDVAPANLNSRLLATLPENGIYLLVAKSYGAVESGRYRLSAKITSPTSSAQAQDNQKVRFFCAQGYDRDAKQKIPTTYVWNPQRQGKIALIRWKSEYFEQVGWNAQQRCEEISPRFQAAYQNGSLRYLTAGLWDKKAVICAARKQGDSCGADYLFTLKPTDEPGLVAQQLMGLLTGDAGGVGVLTQSTGSVYVDFERFLNTAPLEAES